jgi:methylmalonyl-CoA/ethylmalonyl-CoA epimerase
MKFDHVGVVCETLEIGREILSATLLISDWTTEFADSVNHVCVQFGRDGSGICYELVAPFDDRSPILQALKKGVRVLNHVAYLVDDLDREAARLIAAGCTPTGPSAPAIAYGGRRIQFFMNPLRMITELIEAPDHQHAYHQAP